MGSVKLKDLKAFVRYDGSGRVVAGSLVFRKKKPKNGRWGEITKNLCCNPNSSTTTTTTASGSTSTAFAEYYYTNQYNACNSSVSGTLTFYSASTTISSGIAIFQDAALTIPVTAGQVILTVVGGETRYLVGEGGVLTTFTCPTYESRILSGSVGEACSNIGTTMPVAGDPTTNNYLYGNFAGYGLAPITLFFVKYTLGVVGVKQYIVRPDGFSAEVWDPTFIPC